MASVTRAEDGTLDFHVGLPELVAARHAETPVTVSFQDGDALVTAYFTLGNDGMVTGRRVRMDADGASEVIMTYQAPPDST